MNKQLLFTETVLRDGQQSLIATRMPFDDFAPVLKQIDEAGFYSIECWGGATFDSCLRYLNEDPWERLRRIKAVCKKTKLQMLLRGQNLLGYKHYPDDVVRAFVSRAVECGIDIIRIFDALNDLRNMETAIKTARDKKADAQTAIAYTTSPVHSTEYFVKLAKEMENLGATSIAVKDMAGILDPAACFELVSGIKSATDLRVVVHTHCTTGMGHMTYLKAIEAGADIIDTAICAFSGGTSQPPTESMAFIAEQMGYSHNLDFKRLKEINEHFKQIRIKFQNNGTLDTNVLFADAGALSYQIPGGMLSNLISQLKSVNASDKLAAVLDETPKVRKDMGYPPLVTPLSQMVGAQAVSNVLMGKRYKNISKEIKAYIKGEYGKPPGEIDKSLIDEVLQGEKPLTCRPADLIQDGMEEARAHPECENEDDALCYALFPPVAEKYFEQRKEAKKRKTGYVIRKAE